MNIKNGISSMIVLGVLIVNLTILIMLWFDGRTCIAEPNKIILAVEFFLVLYAIFWFKIKGDLE